MALLPVFAPANLYIRAFTFSHLASHQLLHDHRGGGPRVSVEAMQIRGSAPQITDIMARQVPRASKISAVASAHIHGHMLLRSVGALLKHNVQSPPLAECQLNTPHTTQTP